jgi:beta-glucosidase-like glycosyl hydrolase
MKRLGVHVNYAPVVDINNNPNNPVIGYRSFGDDKFKVAKLGLAYTRGMQDAGIMACAKHFPGHGDTEVDSHLDLPVISKSKGQLDSLELYPFKELFKAGVGSVMIAHLSIPAIDKGTNRPTSLSKNNVTRLLQEELHYKGLTFTDALEMKGVTKFFPAGEAAVQALLAGNDMLCLPEDVGAAITAIKTAIKKKKLKWRDIDSKVYKVLEAKYSLGLYSAQVVDTAHLLADINSETEDIKQAVARNTVTVLRNEAGLFPLMPRRKMAYVGIGTTQLNDFGKRLVQDFKADTFLFSYKDGDTKAGSILQQVNAGNYDAVIIGVHDFIMQLPGDYNYNVMERGATLSLGQRQLLSFIRALLYDPSILILDEATSSIDTESEMLIQHAIDKLISGRTSIVIAHRLSTIRKANKILVLDKGEIKEIGTHDELLSKQGFYYQLHKMQFEKQAELV